MEGRNHTRRIIEKHQAKKGATTEPNHADEETRAKHREDNGKGESRDHDTTGDNNRRYYLLVDPRPGEAPDNDYGTTVQSTGTGCSTAHSHDVTDNTPHSQHLKNEVGKRNLEGPDHNGHHNGNSQVGDRRPPAHSDARTRGRESRSKQPRPAERQVKEVLQDLEELADRLDEKDEEIQKQRGLVEKLKKEQKELVKELKKQMKERQEQEEQNSTIRRDYENLAKEMVEIQAENEYAKEKVNEVLQAMQEPGANYDSLKNSQENRRKKRTEQLKALLADLGEVDETQEQSSLAEKLKEKMLEQEERIATTRRDNENLTKKMAKIQAENEDTKEEVKEVLQDLEELADNYAKIQAPRRRGRRCCKTYRNSTTATTKGPRRPRRGTGSTTRSGMSCRSSRAN